MIFPKNMSAITGPVSLRGVVTSGILYARTTEPRVSGMCTALPAFWNSVSERGASEAPKSTVFSVNCLIPPPLPIEA